jgi:hypothetical protein
MAPTAADQRIIGSCHHDLVRSRRHKGTQLFSHEIGRHLVTELSHQRHESRRISDVSGADADHVT